MKIRLAFDLPPRADLSSTAKLVAQVLERETERRFQHCLLSSEMIGALVGRSVRTAQLALAELARKGLVLVQRCRRWRGLLINSGHVITLLWRAEPPLCGAIDCARPAQEIAPDSIPPIPPIEESEDVFEREADSMRPIAPAPPPPPNSQESRKATPDEVREAVAKASHVLRLDEPAARSRVLSLARRWGLSWVVAALERASAKQVFEPLRNPAGYVLRTLQGFQAEGGPPAPPPTLSDEELTARLDRVDAEREAYFASVA